MGLFAEVIFSHFGMFVIVALYTCLGAEMFVHLEHDAEQERYEAKRYSAFAVNQTVNYYADMLWFYGDEQKHNWTEDAYKKKVIKAMKNMESFILTEIEENSYDGTVDGWSWDWTFMNTLLLCMTIVTTIGYGNITPVTYQGQMFCIVYALIGCPLFLIFLANLGDAMAKGFTYIYSRCCCRFCRSRRYLEELPANVSKRNRKYLVDDDVGSEQFMPTSKVFVPIILNIVILHLYFYFGGLMFAAFEHWEPMSAIYFCFVTLSTIGYGDYVPGKSLTSDSKSLETILKLLVSLTYIVLGMALLSMCISLMQEQIVDKCQWAAQRIGLTSNDEVSEPKPVNKRKDSLAPMMANKKDVSPFRDLKPDVGANDKAKDMAPSPIPGIMETN